MTSTANSSRLPLRRGHLADGVFAALAAEILRGEIEAGASMPAERFLSERFGVSKLLVRQAIHRLAEAGLVDVRQGGATRIRDPEDAADLRIFELYYRLAPDSPEARGLARDVLEKQFTQGMSLVDVFARRASAEARAALVALVAEGRAKKDDDAAIRALEERFWRTVGDACGNRILRAEVRWWYTALAARPDMPKPPKPRERWGFYGELARRLQERDAALAYYVATLEPAISALFDRRRAATSSPPRSSPRRKEKAAR